MLRVLGVALLAVLLAACASEAPTRESAATGESAATSESTASAQPLAVKMFRAPT